MALMLRHDSSAGCGWASIRLRWMPLLQKSGPPASTITRVGRAWALRSAAGERLALRRAHGAVVEAKCSQPTWPVLLVADLAPGGRVHHAHRAPAAIRARRPDAPRAPCAAGSLKGGSPPSARRRCVIHTAASRVARRMAPSRCATTATRGDGRARSAFEVRAVQEHRQAQHFVPHAGRTVDGVELAQHGAGCRPAASRSRARPGASAVARTGPARRPRPAPAPVASRPPRSVAASAAARAPRLFGDLAPVQAALGGRPHGKADRWPTPRHRRVRRSPRWR